MSGKEKKSRTPGRPGKIAPLTLRLTKAERDQLEELATGMTLSAYIRSYEAKVAELERQKLVLAEQMTKQVEAPGKFSQSLELALGFLSNPWKIWETGQVSLRRTVLKLAFTDRIKYTRNEGARTPEIALPFRALAGFSGGMLVNGAVRED